MRMYYTLTSFRKLKKSVKEGSVYDNYFQAGKSVAGIQAEMQVSEFMTQVRQHIKG